MLQDIQPYQFNNEFKKVKPTSDDYVAIFKDGELLLNTIGEEVCFPTIEEISKLSPEIQAEAIYLFSINERSVYCSTNSINETAEFNYVNIHSNRETLPKWIVFVAATSYHLVQWYELNRYCGKCASPMTRSSEERLLCCDSCGTTKYPNISPAMIVAITNKDKLLMTRYANGPYKNLALVAGFMEIGETLEDTVKREVMEEVGLKIKNLRYFKSQPWAFSQSVLMGFFADLDGSDEVKIDTKELSEATWFSRDEIPLNKTSFSLTNDMIEAFRANTQISSGIA